MAEPAQEVDLKILINVSEKRKETITISLPIDCDLGTLESKIALGGVNTELYDFNAIKYVSRSKASKRIVSEQDMKVFWKEYTGDPKEIIELEPKEPGKKKKSKKKKKDHSESESDSDKENNSKRNQKESAKEKVHQKNKDRMEALAKLKKVNSKLRPDQYHLWYELILDGEATYEAIPEEVLQTQKRVPSKQQQQIASTVPNMQYPMPFPYPYYGQNFPFQYPFQFPSNFPQQINTGPQQVPFQQVPQQHQVPQQSSPQQVPFSPQQSSPQQVINPEQLSLNKKRTRKFVICEVLEDGMVNELISPINNVTSNCSDDSIFNNNGTQVCVPPNYDFAANELENLLANQHIEERPLKRARINTTPEESLV